MHACGGDVGRREFFFPYTQYTCCAVSQMSFLILELSGRVTEPLERQCHVCLVCAIALVTVCKTKWPTGKMNLMF